MNCFFCNQKLDPEDPVCHNRQTECWQHHVVHCTYGGLNEPRLFKVEFIGYLNGKDLIMDYLIIPNNADTEKPSLTVTERITPPFDPEDESVSVRYTYKQIIKLPYPPITLTPLNYHDKLKTYLTFS